MYVNDSASRTWLWTLSGNQGTQWVQGQVPIPAQTSAYQVTLSLKEIKSDLSAHIICISFLLFDIGKYVNELIISRSND